MANWETFVPDLIVGVVTGGVVGLIILGYERFSAGRRQREDARAVSLRIVHPLLLALQRPIYVVNYSAVLPLPTRWARALDLVEASDVDSWHRVEPTDLTKAIVKFRSRLWDLRADAEDLHAAVDRWERLHAQDPREVEYGLALILEAPPQYLHEAFPDPSERERLRHGGEKMVDSKIVRKHARRHRSAWLRAERATDDLLAELITRIRATNKSAQEPPA